MSISLKEKRKRRSLRVRKKLRGNLERPRLTVFRSHKYLYTQLIDDIAGHTLASARGEKSSAAATKVGTEIAKAALEKGVEKAVFDRGPYAYHGLVAAIAEGARAGGLKL